jgi:hypothetical protein
MLWLRTFARGYGTPTRKHIICRYIGRLFWRPLSLMVTSLPVTAAVLVRWPSSLWRQSSMGLRELKLSRCDGKWCIRKSSAQSPVWRRRFQPIPSCACRSGKTVVQQSKIQYASPYPKAHATNHVRQQIKRNMINITIAANASRQIGNRSRQRRGVLSHQRRGGM